MYFPSKFVFALVLVFFGIGPSFSYPIKKLSTDSGVEFYYMKIEGENRTSFDLTWASDWLASDENNPIIPHLGTRLMMVSGAGDLGAAELQKRFNDVDADASIVASVGNVRGRLTVQNEQLDEVVELANLVLTKATLDERWMLRIADQLDDDYVQSATVSAHLGWDAVRRRIFGSQNVYRFLSNIGLEKFADIQHDGVLEWYRTTFTLADLQIVVTGDHSDDEAIKLVSRLLADMPQGEKKHWTPPRAQYLPKTIVLQSPKVEKTMLAYIGAIPSTRLANEYEQITAVHLLGGNEQSRLFKTVRDELRASYGFNAGVGNFSRENRFLWMSGEIDPEKLQDVRSAVVTAYENYRKIGTTSDEVEALKAAFSNGIKASRDSAAHMSLAIAESLIDGKLAERALRLEEELASMSVESVNRELNSTFPKSEELVELIVTPSQIEIEGACVISKSNDIDHCD